jgi:hypothetical protein
VPNRFATVAAIAVAITAVSCRPAGATGGPTADADVSHRVIVVHGKPFFPVMLVDQCEEASPARTLGINLILNASCTSAPADQLGRLGEEQLAVLDMRQNQTRDKQLAGFTYPDEPENNGWTPEELRSQFKFPRGTEDGLLSFMTTTSAFFRAAPYRDPRIPAETTSALARLADVAGFDLYPLNHCQSDLSAVYEAQRQFGALAGAMPTFQWIETGPLRPSYCGGFTMTPSELTAEAWLAVAGGARGIGFFTHTWTPDHDAFDVSQPVQRAIARFSQLVAAVKPGLLGTSIPSGANSPAIKLVARSGAGRTFVFAVNSADAPVTVQVQVPGLRHGKLTVFGEKRTVTVAGGRFADRFRPLGVHVYVQRG